MFEIKMTEDEFDERYPLVVNHIDNEAARDGCLFDTDGPEYAFVCDQDPRKVWTLVDVGEDGTALLSEFHYVNRLGYLVSRVPVPNGAIVEVRVE